VLSDVLYVKPGENNPHQSVHVQLDSMNVTMTNVVNVLQIVPPVKDLEITVSPVTLDMITNHPFVHVPLTCMKKTKSVMLVTHYVLLVLVPLMVLIMILLDLVVVVSLKLTEDKTLHIVLVKMVSMKITIPPHQPVDVVILNVVLVSKLLTGVSPVPKTLEENYQIVLALLEPSLIQKLEDVDLVHQNVEPVQEMLISVPIVKPTTTELLDLNLIVHVSIDISKNSTNVSSVTTDVTIVLVKLTIVITVSMI
jgi:hypothetical protein